MKTFPFQLSSFWVILFIMFISPSASAASYNQGQLPHSVSHKSNPASNPISKDLLSFVKPKDGFYLLIGFGIISFTLTAITLLALKIAGVITAISWVWVLSPLWILGSLVILAFTLALFMGKKIKANA